MTSLEKDILFWCNYLILLTPIITFYFCSMLNLKRNCLWNRAWKLAATFALCSILMYSFRFNPFLHMLMANSSIILLVLFAFADPLKYKILSIVIFYLSSALAEILAWFLLILLFQIPLQTAFTESWAAENHIYSTIGAGLVNILLLVFYSIIISIKGVVSTAKKQTIIDVCASAYIPVNPVLHLPLYLSKARCYYGYNWNPVFVSGYADRFYHDIFHWQLDWKSNGKREPVRSICPKANGIGLLPISTETHSGYAICKT